MGGLGGAFAEGVEGGGAGCAEGVVVVEGVAVNQEDRVDLGLGDLVEDVASAAAEADDDDALASEAAVDGGDAGAGGGGVAVGKGAVVVDLLVCRAGGGCGRGVEAVCVVGDDPRVRGDLRVLVGVTVRGLAGQHEVRLYTLGDHPVLRIGKGQGVAVLVARGGVAELPPPLPLAEVPLYLLWHQRYDNDHAHTWLRDLATETLQALFTPPTTTQQPLTNRTKQ